MHLVCTLLKGISVEISQGRAKSLGKKHCVRVLAPMQAIENEWGWLKLTETYWYRLKVIETDWECLNIHEHMCESHWNCPKRASEISHRRWGKTTPALFVVILKSIKIHFRFVSYTFGKSMPLCGENSLGSSHTPPIRYDIHLPFIWNAPPVCLTMTYCWVMYWQQGSLAHSRNC